MAKYATDLPELRQHIARYLDLDTLKVCSLVSKAWHLDFHPFLWECFFYKVPGRCLKSPEDRTVWLDITSKKAHLFRHFYHKDPGNVMAREVCDILLDHCYDLITIEVFIDGFSRNHGRYWEETLRPLIERNKDSLRRLHLLQTGLVSMASSHLPILFAGLTSLQSLELGIRTTMEDLYPILQACSTSLKRLDLRTSLLRKKVNQKESVADQQSTPSQSFATPLRLKHFGIHGDCWDRTLADILSCLAVHSLESLHIGAINDGQFYRQVSPTLRDTFSRLTNLRIDILWTNPTPTFQALLDFIPTHQLRKVQLSTMDTERIAMLIQQQHQSLSSVKLRFQEGHGGALGDILATCSKLKTLDFGGDPFVDIRTLIDPQRPWVCNELEVFEGRFGLSPPSSSPLSPLATSVDHGALELGQSDIEDEKVTTSDPVVLDQAEDLFMQRLGRLTKLSRIAYWPYVPKNPMGNGTDIMAWTLSSGLGHLANLVNLRWLEFIDGDLPNGIGIPELLFFKQHWCNLQGLSCYNIDAAEVQGWLGIEWPELEVKFKRSLVAVFRKRRYDTQALVRMKAVGSVG